MSWNTELDWKTSFVWEKKNHKTISETSSTLVQCSLKSRSHFFVSSNFQGTFVDFSFTMLTQVLMKELGRILILVREIFNCRVSFKMLLSVYLTIVEERLWIWLWSSNFQNSTFKKISITEAEVALIQITIPNTCSKQIIKIYTRNTMGSLYHSKVRSGKHRSTTTLVLLFRVLVEAKIFLITLTWQT